LFRLYALNLLQRNVDQLTAQEREQLLEDFIKLKLLADAAVKDGLPDERRIAAELELQRLQLIARHMATRYLERNPATQGELQEMYERMLPRLAETQYKARHILVTSEDEASGVIEELKGGADFATLARERSTGPTASNGGDLGWFTGGTVVQAFGDAVRAMEVGTYSNTPVETRFGFHVILLEERKEQPAPELDAVRTDVTNAVGQEKLQQLMDSLRDDASVVPHGSPE
jgi:peptidyl-prolyl cis-trans isomerase C